LTTALEGTDGTNVTNEADFYDDVRISQTHESADVTVDSGDVSGLDSLRTKPLLRRGGEGGEIGELSSREEELLELDQRILREIESLRSQGEPGGDVLKEMLALSDDLHAYLEAYHSRSP
jgi:hypothetical protein